MCSLLEESQLLALFRHGLSVIDMGLDVDVQDKRKTKGQEQDEDFVLLMIRLHRERSPSHLAILG